MSASLQVKPGPAPPYRGEIKQHFFRCWLLAGASSQLRTDPPISKPTLAVSWVAFGCRKGVVPGGNWKWSWLAKKPLCSPAWWWVVCRYCWGWSRSAEGPDACRVWGCVLCLVSWGLLLCCWAEPKQLPSFGLRGVTGASASAAHAMCKTLLGLLHQRGHKIYLAAR